MPELKKTSNPAENAFIEWASKHSWNVHSSGWPDFLCVAEADRVIAVEVKDGSRPERQLSDEQDAVMRLLEKAGVPCYTWTPRNGLLRFGRQGVVG